MSSMLKKKSGFKPKAPIRRNASSTSSPAPGPATTRAATTPIPPSSSPAQTEKVQASVTPLDAGPSLPDTQIQSRGSVADSETHHEAPTSTVIADATEAQTTQPSRLENTTVDSGTVQSQSAYKSAPTTVPHSPSSLRATPSGTDASTSDLGRPAIPTIHSVQPPATLTTPSTSTNGPPVASLSDSPASSSLATPLTPRATLPSVETPEKIDTRVTTRQAATVAARLTAHNQTPSLTPGAERRSTPLANVLQTAALRTQPIQAATPPAESVSGRGSTIEASLESAVATSSSSSAKRGPKRKATDGSTVQPKRRSKKRIDKDEGEASTETPRGKRKRQAGDVENGEAIGEAENGSSNRCEKSASDGLEDRKRREDTPEDAENQKIDITKVKMAELARDLRIGKKFSLHDQLVLQERERRQRYIEGRKKKGDSEAPGDAGEQGAREASGTPALNVGVAPTADAAGSGQDTLSGESMAAVGPQFQIVDGQIVLDASSLQVDRHARAAEDAGNQEVVEENDFTRKVTSATYLRRKRKPQQWTDEETEEFYRLLRIFGTDFETISRMIPGKDRNNVIGKFRREDKTNPKLITEALTGPKTMSIDIGEYERLAGEKLETTEAIIAEQKAAEEEFEAEEKRREEEAAEEARKKREALYGKDGPGSLGDNEGGDAATMKLNKKHRGKRTKARHDVGMP